MDDRPLLLIDVDGVLNPYDLQDTTQGWVTHRLMGYKVQLNPLHGEWLNGLADRFDLTWGTTWEDDANKLIGPIIGLPKLPVCRFPHSGGETWKLPDARKFVGSRAVAWIDDDLHEDADAWAAERWASTLLLHIDPLHGLQPEHIAELERFASSLVKP